jgi:4-hydroxy-tetrahydrodipicolinate synthase
MNTQRLRLGGSIAALVTPFRDDQIDEDAFAALCARQIARGTSALVPCGTTGEAPLLTPDEHRRVIEIAVAAAAGRVPVIAGAGTCSTAASVSLARQAERAGASALLCVTPYYLRPTQKGVIQHVRAIHDAVGLPIVLYDMPSRTACALQDETVRRLAELPRVIGLKDATADLRRPGRLLRLIGSDFLLLSGDDATRPTFASPAATAASRRRPTWRRRCARRCTMPGTRRISSPCAARRRPWRRCMPPCSWRPTRSR